MGAFTAYGSKVYNRVVILSRSKTILPAVISAGSFLFLLVFCLFSSPVDNIGLAIIFFLASFIFLISFGHFLIYLRRGKINSNDRYRITITSIFILLMLMFSSAQSLSLVDIFILVLIVFGLLFYGSRRTK